MPSCSVWFGRGSVEEAQWIFRRTGRDVRPRYLDFQQCIRFAGSLAPVTRVLAIALFTDIVGSTELRSRVGDDEADRSVARHDAVVGELVPAHGGRVVKYLGDGALATFSSAVDATEAASAIQARLADSGPSIRIGIHAGRRRIL